MKSKLLFVLHFIQKFYRGLCIIQGKVTVSIATHFSIDTLHQIHKSHILKDMLVLIKGKVQMNTTNNHTFYFSKVLYK